MKWTLWNAFRQVAEHGGFSAAAAASHTSQPSLSAQVAELEASLQTRLLDRLPRGVRLTAAGELFLQSVKRVEQDALRSLAELQGLQRGRLRVGASQTIGVYLLPQLLGDFHCKHPQVELHAEISNTKMLHEAVAIGTLDLALTEGSVPAQATLQSECFHQDELVAVASSKDPWRERSLTLARLCRRSFLRRELGSGTRAMWEAELMRRGLPFPQVALTLGNTESLKRAVQANLGVTVLSRLAVQAEVADGRLILLRVRDLSLTRSLHLVRCRDTASSPAAHAFATQVMLQFETRSS